MNNRLKNTDVVILCGGEGTRLRAVIGDTPKALVKVNGRTVLDILIDGFTRAGFGRAILCVGHGRERIEEHFARGTAHNVVFSEEDAPLGTGGALKNANALIQSETFLVTNGDSFCFMDFAKLLVFHNACGAVATMALTRVKDKHDYGSVTLGKKNEIESFAEKGAASGSSGLVNTGLYLMRKDVFSRMPDKRAFSLEVDVFPKMTRPTGGGLYGYITEGQFVDIGTPERLRAAQGMTVG